MSKKKKRNNKKNKLILITVLAVMAFLGVIYSIGLIYFNSHFMFNTIVNNSDVSNMNVTKANELLNQSNPVLKIIEKNKNGVDTVEENLDLKALDESIVYDSSDVLKNQDKLLWFISPFKQYRFTCDKLNGTYNDDKLNSLIENLYCVNKDNIVEPVEAHIEIENGRAVLKNAVDGSFIKSDILISNIKNKIDELLKGSDSSTLDLTQFYESASVREDDPSFENLIKQAQSKLDKSISINVSDNASTSLSGTAMADLLTVNNNNVAVNDTKINDYIASFANKYDVSSYEYIDKSSLKKKLSDALLSDSDSTIKVDWIVEQKKGLIEVNVSEQMMYYYENDVLLLSSPVVTGNPDITEETPHGRFTVRRKNQNSTLFGEGYVEHVNYWIGFDETGRVYGLHDAPWRDSFGDDIYLSDPSRGCVNMPTDRIAILYDYVDLDTEVYIHD